MIEIDGKFYIIDMDKLMSWIVETPSSEKNINTITTMSYPITNDEEEQEIVEKEVSETKSTLNETMNNVRYDLVRNLINVLLTTYINDMNQIISLSKNDLSFGQRLAFNTLFYKNIIIEVSNKDNE
jgi:hypothetical protein